MIILNADVQRFMERVVEGFRGPLTSLEALYKAPVEAPVSKCRSLNIKKKNLDSDFLEGRGFMHTRVNNFCGESVKINEEM